ncbi:YdcF family protein [Vibrio atypicus]|uniref:YdcF family protein n=1 Tax=Vibrio atypicus TaxID=558271 RepID=UPI001358877E|nr:YdcF family protein [Vibrio atypicus]
MRTGQTESIRDVIIVLGKRLVCDELTLEGRSRVEALPEFLSRCNLKQTALVFCGGITQGQTCSEAGAMFRYYQQIKSRGCKEPQIIILEEESTNTIENIENGAIKLISSEISLSDQLVTVSFVSNDYHLERIFQIQSLMDEQGLLRVLKQRCEKAGRPIRIPTERNAHCYVTYPHRTKQGLAFLALDELTVYRVYLEGVVKHAFSQPNKLVRCQPAIIARAAIERLWGLGLEQSTKEKIDLLASIIEQTDENASIELIRRKLNQFNVELTALNRRLDPESGYR